VIRGVVALHAGPAASALCRERLLQPSPPRDGTRLSARYWAQRGAL